MNIKPIVSGFMVAVSFSSLLSSAQALEISSSRQSQRATVNLVSSERVSPITIDANDDPLVKLTARLLADDIERVTGHRPPVSTKLSGARQIVIAGTLGSSALVDRLAAQGKLKRLDQVRGRWEATVWQIVEHPFPGVERALVIVGSDRRGTAYGMTRLSEKIGVSPWYWWADVSVRHRDTLAVGMDAPETDEPAVRYRGIFINDEDWGLHTWAKHTFEPGAGGIGPRTYEKIFELMLRLRLNYIWPAMHEVSREFHFVPENIALADQYGIVAGASHCEPMLYNNAKWNSMERGRWNYMSNRATIFREWEQQAMSRGKAEAVWTLGIRGIHDKGMESPPGDLPGKLKLMGEVIADQRELIKRNVTQRWGPVAQAFVPYKEVLPIYDAGLPLPDDVTVVWVDDNFGYIRRLGSPEERKRAGGAGVYWHLSYYGGPHSYLWINSTAPALMWEELHKAWENEARRMWVINVGDIKPMEIGIDYFAHFAWKPTAFGPDSQPAFLRTFAEAHFGAALAPALAELLTEFYRLGTVRKPELMARSWALSLPQETAVQLRHDYATLLSRERQLAARVPAELRDAYVEMVGFPARVLGATGAIFMADRAAQLGEHAEASKEHIAHQRKFLEQEVVEFNTAIAHGKWKHMMPGLVTANDLMAWNSQVRWPWGEKTDTASPQAAPLDAGRIWRAAVLADRQSGQGEARWTAIDGLGHTGRAMALKPASLASAWDNADARAPALVFDFESSGSASDEVLIDFMPTFRLYPGMQLRVSVRVDDRAAVLVEVPGSSGKEDENGAVRRDGIQNNFVRARVPVGALAAGKHALTIRAVDPGVVIDRISLPAKN
jgi:hypothetical protein